MPRILFSALIVICIITSFNSCKKITEDQLINGIWNLEDVYLDSSTNNYLSTFPEYNLGNGCCNYIMDFQDNGVVLAYYGVNDSVKYLVAGQWQLPEYNKIVIQCDKFINGTFDIAKPTIKHWELTSTADYVQGFDTSGLSSSDTVSAKLEIYKN